MSGTPIVLRQIYLKADEGSIAGLLKTTAENHPHVLIGSYPSFFREEYSVKVTLEARAGEAVGSALDELQGRLNDAAAKVVKVT